MKPISPVCTFLITLLMSLQSGLLYAPPPAPFERQRPGSSGQEVQLDDLADLPTQQTPPTIRFFNNHPYVLSATVTAFVCFILLNFDPQFRSWAKKTIAWARLQLKKN